MSLLLTFLTVLLNVTCDTHTNAKTPITITTATVSNTSTPPMAVADPQDLVGCTFLMDECNDGQPFRAKIVKCIHDHAMSQPRPAQTSDHVKFQCSVNDDAYKDLILYNEMMDSIQKNAENDQVLWWFKCIIGHKGPLKPSTPATWACTSMFKSNGRMGG